MQPTLISALSQRGAKTQVVRLMDIFVFGPLMIAAATEQKSKYFKAALTLVGIGTIVYNGVNYLETARLAKQTDQLAGLAQRIAPDPRYIPHVHTPSCPAGHPVAPGACIR